MQLNKSHDGGDDDGGEEGEKEQVEEDKGGVTDYADPFAGAQMVFVIS